jgi:hypothetical protein
MVGKKDVRGYGDQGLWLGDGSDIASRRASKQAMRWLKLGWGCGALMQASLSVWLLMNLLRLSWWAAGMNNP